MAETTVRYKTTADIRDLQAWTRATREAAKALDDMTAAKKRADATASQSRDTSSDASASGPPGTPPPPPPAPNAPGGVDDGEPDAGAAPTRRRRKKKTEGGAPGAAGAPPPPPLPPSPTQPTPPRPAPPRPPPPQPGEPEPGEPENEPAAKPPKPPTGPTWRQSAWNAAKTGVATGIGLGLGNSLLGFILGSGETFMELDKILTQLDQRFGNASGIRQFGADLGFTIERAADLAMALGNVTDVVDTGVARRYGGFARVRGLDPGTTMTQLGTIGRMAGAPLSNAALNALSGQGAAVGMGRGRLPEYLEVVQQLMGMQQRATGAANPDESARLLQLAYRAAGGSDRGTGMNAVDMLGRLQGVITGGPLSVFMMRAMGYGRDPSLGYVEMRKRMEAGINDPRNLSALFETFQKRGYTEGQQFRALESVAGGQLTAVEIESLIKQLGTEEGLKEYMAAPTSLGALVGDYGSAGAGAVSRGEARAVQLESLKMQVGEPVSQVMVDMTSSLMNLADVLRSLLGAGVGDMLTSVSGGIKDFTTWLKTSTPNLDALSEIRDILKSMWAWLTGSIIPPSTTGGSTGQRGP